MSRPFELIGDGVVLNEPREDDIDALYAACTTPVVYEYLNVPWPYERTHAEGFVREYAPAVRSSQRGQECAIRTEPDGPMLGTLGLIRLDDTTGEVGFHLFEAARGKGLATRALRLLLEWAFDNGCETVKWEAIAGNHASAQVAQRLGFTFDGEAPSSVSTGRHVGRQAWVAHIDKADFLAESDGAQRPWWPSPGELPEAPPLPPL
ncbi:MAG: GNAT family N-acetyltransferase [Propionibacteriaceae bacterium]|nr:GNAT family N-acetyltransferase [Propionibacteriaceae bacterium]